MERCDAVLFLCDYKLNIFKIRAVGRAKFEEITLSCGMS